MEVYKLCDRFIAPKMGEYIKNCITVAIGDRHRAIFRAQSDEDQQKALIRDFADGYEALELSQTEQKELGKILTLYFCEAVNYEIWVQAMEEVMDRPRFVGTVSRGFAKKLSELVLTRKFKRKELKCPNS